MGAAGTDAVRLDPAGSTTGHVTLALYDVSPDPAYAIMVGGAAA